MWAVGVVQINVAERGSRADVASAPGTRPATARWAWITLAAVPGVTLCALAMAFALEDRWWSEALAVALVAATFLTAIALGVRAARRGAVAGAYAAATATAGGLFVVTFLVFANAVDGVSASVSSLIAAALAAVVFVIAALAGRRLAGGHGGRHVR